MLGIGKGIRQNYYAEELTHLNIFQLEKHIDLIDKYIFTFVRDPYTKILSEYNWRMRNRSSVIFNEPTRQQLSFIEYMELLVDRWEGITSGEDGANYKYYRTKAHVLPQHTFIDDRVEVYRYEDYDSECKRLMKRLGISNNVQRVNIAKYKTQHTQRTIEITNTLYAEDFKVFGYKTK
jgi:hypothetical protein